MPDPLLAYLDDYLCEAHVKDAGSGCLIAACVSDVPRQDDSVGADFAESFLRLVELVQGALSKGIPEEMARRRSIALVSAMVGSVAMARAVERIDPDLSREIIAAARGELEQLAVRQ